MDRCNFQVFLKEMGGESETVEVHRFGHWGPGWFELILINPTDTEAVAKAEEMEAALSDYPILDEEAHSRMEWEETSEYWARMSVRERIDYLHRAELSIFAARRDSLPEDDDGRLWELLTRE